VGPGDFAVSEIRAAFVAIADRLAGDHPGPVELPGGESPEVSVLIDLATDDAPADPVDDVLWRVRDRAVARQVSTLESELETVPAADQRYSELMAELVRLRKARKVRVHE
jgi:hypothetical protein